MLLKKVLSLPSSQALYPPAMIKTAELKRLVLHEPTLRMIAFNALKLNFAISSIK